MATYDTADSAAADNDAQSFDGQSPSKLSQTQTQAQILFGGAQHFPSSSPVAAAAARAEDDAPSSPAGATGTDTGTVTFSSLLAAAGVEATMKMDENGAAGTAGTANTVNTVNTATAGTLTSPLSDAKPRPLDALALPALGTPRPQHPFYATQLPTQPHGLPAQQPATRFYEPNNMFSMPRCRPCTPLPRAAYSRQRRTVFCTRTRP